MCDAMFCKVMSLCLFPQISYQFEVKKKKNNRKSCENWMIIDFVTNKDVLNGFAHHLQTYRKINFNNHFEIENVATALCSQYNRLLHNDSFKCNNK